MKHKYGACLAEEASDGPGQLPDDQQIVHTELHTIWKVAVVQVSHGRPPRHGMHGRSPMTTMPGRSQLK